LLYFCHSDAVIGLFLICSIWTNYDLSAICMRLECWTREQGALIKIFWNFFYIRKSRTFAFYEHLFAQHILQIT